MPFSIPKPPYKLQFFYPFLDYMLLPITERLKKMGVSNPAWSARQILVSQPSTSSLAKSSVTLCPTKSIKNAVKIGIMEFVISQAGWLTWEDYLWLIVSCRDDGPGGFLKLVDMSQNPKKLQEEVSYLYDILDDEDMRPFAPVLKMIMERYLLEVEMRKKYLKAVQKRYRDFASYGRSLKFGFKDLEDDIATGEVEGMSEEAMDRA